MLPALLTYVPFVQVDCAGAGGGATYVPTEVTWAVGGVVTVSLTRVRPVSTPSVVVIRQVFVWTPVRPGVVTTDVPLARVASWTVCDAKGTETVSVTVFVATTGVGVGVGVAVRVGLAVGVLSATRACGRLDGALVDVWVAAATTGSDSVGCVAPNAEPEPIITTSATPAPIAAADRFRGSRSHVVRRKTAP